MSPMEERFLSSGLLLRQVCLVILKCSNTYKLGYVARGSTAFKVVVPHVT